MLDVSLEGIAEQSERERERESWGGVGWGGVVVGTVPNTRRHASSMMTSSPSTTRTYCLHSLSLNVLFVSSFMHNQIHHHYQIIQTFKSFKGFKFSVVPFAKILWNQDLNELLLLLLVFSSKFFIPLTLQSGSSYCITAFNTFVFSKMVKLSIAKHENLSYRRKL